jgi:hypothetical protein
MSTFTVEELRELALAVRAYSWAKDGNVIDEKLQELESKLVSEIWRKTK